MNRERRKEGEERWEAGKGKKLIGKHGVKRERRKMVWGEEKHTESFVTT